MQPFYQTRNAALAVTLATCGVPFALDEEDKPRPFVHIYDAETLHKLGYTGISHADAARDAWKKGKRGNLVYNFQRTPLLDRILKAFDRQSQIIKESDERGDTSQRSLEIDPETAAALCCQFTKNRNTFTQGWRTVTPYLAVQGESHIEHHGEKTEIVGSFKLVSLSA